MESRRQFTDRVFLGLIDEGESVEEAAIRELREETGYVVEKVVDTTGLLVADPGEAHTCFGHAQVHILILPQV